MKANQKSALVLVAISIVALVMLLISVSVAPASAAGKPPTKTPTPIPPTATPSGPTPTPAPAATYYVDCSAVTNGTGTQASPWNNLSTVNSRTFIAGDKILFKRGTICVGQLWPKGSGVNGNPITVSAYGTGGRPIINGNFAVSVVVTIKDQNYWTFDSLEIKNSTGKGLYVDGTSGADLYGFTLTNLYVHHMGLNDDNYAVLAGQYQNHSVHDVLIDNVVTHDAFRGIGSGGKCCNIPASRSTNFVVRNSTVYNVQSDGVLIASVNNGLVENTVAYNTGIMTTLINHTPNALWTWDCDDCVVQLTEAYESHSPSWDGGAYDIDYYSHRNIVQYNYGHDNDTYCVAVFGGGRGDVTTDSIVRYNICSNDGRDGTQNPNRSGAIYLSVWSGGSVGNTYIYNNTVYWNPSNMTSHYGIFITKMAGGSTITNTNIYNNIIYSASPNLVWIDAFADATQTHLDHNLYWYTGAGNPSYKWGATAYTSFSAWKTGSGQDAHSLYANPLLNDPTYHALGFPTTSFTLQAGSPAINAGANLVALGKVTSMCTRDFFGNPIPVGAYDIGAYERP